MYAHTYVRTYIETLYPICCVVSTASQRQTLQSNAMSGTLAVTGSLEGLLRIANLIVEKAHPQKAFSVVTDQFGGWPAHTKSHIFKDT